MSAILSPDFSKDKKNLETWLEKEWLVSNGLGGYSSSSISCIPTRKYHGFLVASLPETGRTVMLNHLLEIITLEDGREIIVNDSEKPDANLDLKGIASLEEFFLENGTPVWRYNFEGVILEKRIFMTYRQNTSHVVYSLLSEGVSVELKLCPYMHFTPISEELSTTIQNNMIFTIEENQYEVSYGNYPSLKLRFEGEGLFTLNRHKLNEVFFRREARRGYQALGAVWTPGYFRMTLNKERRRVALTASVQDWEEIQSIDPFEALEIEQARKSDLLKKAPKAAESILGRQLVLAADDFIIIPSSRIRDKTRANAGGDEIRTVIAGYHWFGDWGRDTMISLEGLTLYNGREDEARWILHTFAYYVKNGLIPNMFPEGYKEGLYHTADATLWFFHALKRYLDKTHDRDTLKIIFPKLLEIYHAHKKGTLFGIRMDPEDGLLMQGQEGYQLTWMDAKVDDWVVTPRRGKAVEINALWYNALRIFETWLQEESQSLSHEVRELAEQVYRSFNLKFWNPEIQCLFDVIEGEKGNDEAIRPNQLFAISLDYPVLEKKYWPEVFEIAKKELLTPLGLRSLAANHPDFKQTYSGDLRARDAAYHQGTVWSWLIGPYIDVWLKLYPEEKGEVHKYLNGFLEHLKDAGIGFISEIFDALPPHRARGCIAQAWSIAELLRCLNKVM